MKPLIASAEQISLQNKLMIILSLLIASWTILMVRREIALASLLKQVKPRILDTDSSLVRQLLAAVLSSESFTVNCIGEYVEICQGPGVWGVVVTQLVTQRSCDTWNSACDK